MKFTDNQNSALINLLWNSLGQDPEHKDRRQTTWGTKTKEGLIACIERIVENPRIDDPIE